MSRDHRKLRVFHDAHRLALAIYKHTKTFPRDEWFGLRQQMRKAAVSVATNIVEGNARRTTKEYCNFLNIALGSASELAYLLTLVVELELIVPGVGATLRNDSSSVLRQMQALVGEMEARLAAEHRQRPPRDRRPQTVDRRPQTADRRP